MSFIQNFLEKYSTPKETSPTSKKRKMPSKVENKNYFRTTPLQTHQTSDGEVFEEKVSREDLIADSSSSKKFRYSDFGEEKPERLTSASSSSSTRKVISTLPCPFKIGLDSFGLSSAQMAVYDRSLVNSTRCGLKFSYSAVDDIIGSDSVGDEMRMMAFGLRGMMKLMELQNECKSSDKESTTQMTLILDPNRLSLEPHIMVAGLEQDELNVNEILAELPIFSGSLRAVVHAAANHWIARVIPEGQRHMYSGSSKPQHPNISFPPALMNAPTQVLINSLVISGRTSPQDIREDDLATEIGIIFKEHCTNLFNGARFAKKRQA